MEGPRLLVSIVVPVLNEEDCLPVLHAELCRACDPLPYDFEFLFVDDGSTDRTPDVMAKLRGVDPRVRYLVLSRNFGHQAALCAGLEHAVGDAVISMDGDLQHPPALIPVLLERFRAGFDVVNTHREKTAEVGWFKGLLSAGFYRFFNWFASIRIQPGGADFRLLSRRVVDVLNRLPEVRRFLRGLIPWLGFPQTVVAFEAPARHAGVSKYNFAKSLRLAMEGITAFSLNPLRKVAFFGLWIAVASFAYGLFGIGLHLFTDKTVPGWTSLLACTLFLGGFQFIILGIVGEYLGRVLEQVTARPRYLVKEEGGERKRAAQDAPMRRAG